MARWSWHVPDLIINVDGRATGAMASALEAASQATATCCGDPQLGRIKLLSYFQNVGRAGPAQALPLTPAGVRVGYGFVPPPMRWYWAPHTSHGECLLFLQWSWCREDPQEEAADHESRKRDADDRLKAFLCGGEALHG